jgi:phosphotransferase system HPr (HPr) family protein
MASIIVTVRSEEGWHARPITAFAGLVAEFVSASDHEVTIGRVGAEQVRADSVLSLMTLGVRQNEQLEIVVSESAADAASIVDFFAKARELF